MCPRANLTLKFCYLHFSERLGKGAFLAGTVTSFLLLNFQCIVLRSLFSYDGHFIFAE